MRIRKKDKKGVLLGEEVVKIIVAAICIVVLVAFLFNLYFSKMTSDKFKQAQSILNSESEGSLKTKILNLQEGQTIQFSLLSPKGWYLVSFLGDFKPNSCFGKNCMCICEGASAISAYMFYQSSKERQANKCNDMGACLVVESLKEFSDIKIRMQEIKLSKIDGQIGVEE